MARAVSPSEHTITKGQAGKFVDLLVEALVKSGLPRAETQQVLEHQGAALAAQFIALVQAKVDQVSKIVRRTAVVDRSLSPQAAISATGRRQYVTEVVLEAMPLGHGESVMLEFIRLGKWMNDEAVEDFLAEYGLVAADPFAVAAHNAVDPDFASKYPCFTHWQDENDKWCCAAFDDWVDERDVRVSRDDDGWSDVWWVAGVRK